MMTRLIVGGMALVLCAGFSSGAIAAEQQGSTVAGQVADSANTPIAGADVVLLSADGKEIARSVTDATGTYSFGCIPAGNYEMELVPNNGFKGQRVVAPVGANGMAVAWVVDNQNPTIVSAAATGGACTIAPVVADAGGAAAGAEGAAAADASATASATGATDAAGASATASATGATDAAAGAAAGTTTVADATGTGAAAGGGAAASGGGLSTSALLAGGGALIAGGIAGVAIAAGTGAFSSSPDSPAQ